MPKRKRSNGGKQANAQLIFLERPKSYQNIFFNVSPNAIKEVKQDKIPKINPNFIKFPLITLSSPEIDSMEVFGPQTPNMIKMKNI